MPTKLLLTAAFVVAAVVTGVANAGRTAAGDRAQRAPPHVRVVLVSGVIDLYHSAPVRVSGIAARAVEARLVGAIDRAGRAFEWTPYRWRVLRNRHGGWRGLLPAPPLLGIYRLELRLGRGRILSSPRWLLRVFPRGAAKRRSFAAAAGAVRDFVAHLPGRKMLVALRRWPLARFDHRDPRLNRIFVISYAPRGDSRRRSRLGLFVTCARDGLQGRWRVLEATTQPYA